MLAVSRLLRHGEWTTYGELGAAATGGGNAARLAARMTWHPDFANVWLAGGGSGHGFKHGPAVGEYLSSRILGGGSVEPRFSLESKGQTQQRTVY